MAVKQAIPALLRLPVGRSMAAAVLALATLVFTAGASSAATVAKLVFSPSPIGTLSLTPGSSVNVTVTAEDSNGVAIPGASVWLIYTPAGGGGTASVGVVQLALKAKMFPADASGHVTVVYTAPAPFPATGCDDIHAQNAASKGTSTAAADDTMCFSPVTSMSFAPRPIARRGTLGAGTSVTVTLTVLGTGGTPLVGGTVYLNFKPAAGSNATASVGGFDLTGTMTPETTDGGGHIVVKYTTGSTLPASGSDRLGATNSLKLGMFASDSYSF